MIWYVAAGSDGFTSDPAQAVKDRKGNPLICPGDMNRVWKAHYARDNERKERLWTMLLNAMESECFLEENDPVAEARVEARIEALREAVALFVFGEVTENNLLIVERESEMRYERS